MVPCRRWMCGCGILTLGCRVPGDGRAHPAARPRAIGIADEAQHTAAPLPARSAESWVNSAKSFTPKREIAIASFSKTTASRSRSA